jgi:hypothetical protein
LDDRPPDLAPPSFLHARQSICHVSRCEILTSGGDDGEPMAMSCMNRECTLAAACSLPFFASTGSGQTSGLPSRDRSQDRTERRGEVTSRCYHYIPPMGKK